MRNDETSRDAVAMNPPAKTVALIPNLSTLIPARGEQHRVKPNVREPIRAGFVQKHGFFKKKNPTDIIAIFVT